MKARHSILVTLLLFTLVIAGAGQEQAGKMNRCDYTGELVRSWLDLPAVAPPQAFSFIEKHIYWGGDAIAGGIALGLSPEELRDPARLDPILSLLRISFSQPEIIRCKECRNPRVTWLLLYFLEHEVKDDAAKRKVIETEEYISSQTKQKVPWRSVSP